MTNRVYDCQRRLIVPRARPLPPPAAGRPTRGRTLATLTAAVLVPLAGAAEPPHGWIAASLAALAVLVTLHRVGARAPWGGIALGAALIGIAAPRGDFAAAGPALFVATALGALLWLVNHGQAGPPETRPAPGSRERAAQQLMGLSGERFVGQVLARDLPNEFVLINGLTLPRGAGDIDHLVVGPSGVFLVETKTMAGRVECDADGTWRRTRLGRFGAAYPAYIGDPANQVNRNIFAARNCLRGRLPHLFHGTPLWLEGLVVFPHPRTELLADHSRVPAVRVEDAVAHICLHTPRRGLQAADVDAVVDALLAEGQAHGQRVLLASQSAQSVVELALALPVVLAVLFGTVAVSRVVQTQTAVVAAAHEGARAAALATRPDVAVDRLRRRVALVAPGLGLDPRGILLDWDVSAFGQDPGRVTVRVQYAVDLRDLPLAGWAPLPIVHAQHTEWVDPFRSGVGVQAGVGR